MPKDPDILETIAQLSWEDLPNEVRQQSKLCLLDLIGVAAGGTTTRLSKIARDYAVLDMSGPLPLIFDGRGGSVAGVAMAGGMTIDALDEHDGLNPAKGHAGCGLLPAIYAVAQEVGRLSGRDLLLALTLGYELACRTGLAQHTTSPDYHTSGAWVAVAGVAVRMMGLTRAQTAHAMGIAEYHWPRSQMMRCIDHPTMVKDGSGWGSMCGVSAARMAKAGFTGATALRLQTEHWQDLGVDWLILQQYFKPYPVCRWAQGPIAAVLDLKARHKFSSQDVAGLHIVSFHEAVRLGHKNAITTEEAQYFTSFPCALALVHGTVMPQHVADEALGDPKVQRLSAVLSMDEDNYANRLFPLQRMARAEITLHAGDILKSGWFEPKWDAAPPPHRANWKKNSTPMRGLSWVRRAAMPCTWPVMSLDKTEAQPLFDLLSQPIS